MGVYHSIEVEGTMGFQRNFQECLVKHVIMRHVSGFAMCIANTGCRFASRFHSLVPIGWLLIVHPCSISPRDGFLFPISFHRDYGLFEKYKTRNGTFVHSLLSDRINHSTTNLKNKFIFFDDVYYLFVVVIVALVVIISSINVFIVLRV